MKIILPANTLLPGTDDEYPSKFDDTDYKPDISLFLYQLLKNNPGKLLQNSEKNPKNINDKTIILLNLYRTLIYQEANNQPKNQLLEDIPTSQYQDHLQVTKIQACQNKTMPELPPTNIYSKTTCK